MLFASKTDDRENNLHEIGLDETMFRQNQGHQQRSLFGMQGQLPKDKSRRLQESWGWSFYELVFPKINEETFAPLFVSDNGRPNASINCLVGAEVLVHWRNWTIRELMEHLDFDLLTRTALGSDN